MSDQIPYWQRRQQMKLGKSSTAESGVKLHSSEKSEEVEKQPSKSSARKSGVKKQEKPIRKVSKKRAKQERQYKPVRRKFLAEHSICELKLEGCTGASSEVHHSAGRENGRLLKVDDFKAACHNCHVKATEHSCAAIAAGHSKSRLGKPEK